MITITHGKNFIEVSGHAEFDEPGKDIVCAAVSVLLQNLFRSVHELTHDVLHGVFAKGYSKIVYKENLSDGAQVLMDSFFIGCQMIAESYPDNVRIVQALNTLKAMEK